MAYGKKKALARQKYALSTFQRSQVVVIKCFRINQWKALRSLPIRMRNFDVLVEILRLTVPRIWIGRVFHCLSLKQNCHCWQKQWKNVMFPKDFEKPKQQSPILRSRLNFYLVCTETKCQKKKRCLSNFWVKMLPESAWGIYLPIKSFRFGKV